MRQLQVHVPTGRVEPVLALAREHGAAFPTALPTRGPEGGDSGDALIIASLPNDRVGLFVKAVVDAAPEVRITLSPTAAVPIEPPLDRVAERVRDVSTLSTLELVLSSLQSVGSWTGMIVYSVLAGVIGAYGVIFDVGFLLVAAMLVNPMGAPAMVAVIGLSVGDLRIFGKGGLRFLVSLLVQATAALALGFGYALDVSTPMMEQITSLSTWAVVLALAAGAAGAQAQVKSERDSLVSGTAAGFMVAAALAPPAAVLGLSVPLARWDYAALMAFVLTLQFVAIGLGGWLALRLFGVRPADPSVGRGRRLHRNLLAAGVAAVVIAMVAWQTTLEPSFTKADHTRAALQLTRDAVEAVEGARMIDSEARFTRGDHHEREALLIRVLVERLEGADGEEALEASLREAVSERATARLPGVIPFVDVTVLPSPDG